MKLKIRYENEYQIINLNPDETEQLVNNLPVYGPWLNEAEKIKRIQSVWDTMLNFPDYNSYHTYQRHSTSQEANLNNVTDDSVFYDDDNTPRKEVSDEAICQYIKDVFNKKPVWADAMICVCIHGMSIRKFSNENGYNESSISQQLKRAKKKMRKILLSALPVPVDYNTKEVTRAQREDIREYLRNVLG